MSERRTRRQPVAPDDRYRLFAQKVYPVVARARLELATQLGIMALLDGRVERIYVEVAADAPPGARSLADVASWTMVRLGWDNCWLPTAGIRTRNKPGAVRMMPELGSSIDFPNNSQPTLHFN
jgi:hypothetical protein